MKRVTMATLVLFAVFGVSRALKFPSLDVMKGAIGGGMNSNTCRGLKKELLELIDVERGEGKADPAVILSKIEELGRAKGISRETSLFGGVRGKEWKVLYTTEKEINFFVDYGFVFDDGRAIQSITQKIEAGTIENVIPFKVSDARYFNYLWPFHQSVTCCCIACLEILLLTTCRIHSTIRVAFARTYFFSIFRWPR